MFFWNTVYTTSMIEHQSWQPYILVRLPAVVFDVYSYRKMHVAYNDGFRQLMHEPRWCSASQLFAANNVPSFDANICKLVYSLWRLYVSDNVLVRTASCSDLFAISPVFREWRNILFLVFLVYCISLYFIIVPHV